MGLDGDGGEIGHEDGADEDDAGIIEKRKGVEETVAASTMRTKALKKDEITETKQGKFEKEVALETNPMHLNERNPALKYQEVVRM